MKCPACTSMDDVVDDSRLLEAGTQRRRRRRCMTCGHRWKTIERVADNPDITPPREGWVPE